MIGNFFTDAELSPLKDEVDEVVEILAERLYKAGKIKGVRCFSIGKAVFTTFQKQQSGIQDVFARQTPVPLH